MPATRFFSKLSSLLDVALSSPADGQVLTYQASTGKWRNAAASTGSGSSTIGGGWYRISGSGCLGFTTRAGAYATPGEGVLYAYQMPWIFASACTLTVLGCHVQSAGSSGCVVRLGLYADAGGKPGALVVDAGTVSVASSGNPQLTVSAALSADTRYWVAAVMQGGASTRAVMFDIDSNGNGYDVPQIPNGNARNVGDVFNGGGPSILLGYYVSGVTGALPAIWTYDNSKTFGANLAPRITLAVSTP